MPIEVSWESIKLLKRNLSLDAAQRFGGDVTYFMTFFSMFSLPMTVRMLESLQQNGILLDWTEKTLRDDHKNLQQMMHRCEPDPYYTTIRLQRDADMLFQVRRWYNNWVYSASFDPSFTQISPLACGIASDNLTYKYTHVLWLREMIEDTGPKSSYQAEWQAMDRISRNQREYFCSNQFTLVSRNHVYIVSRIEHPILFYDCFSQKPIVNWHPPSIIVPGASCPRCEKKMAVKICHANAECMFCQVYYKKEGGKWVVDTHSQVTYCGYEKLARCD